MIRRITSTQWTVVVLTGIALLAALVVWFGPAERTLGQGIKIVYVHVPLVWTGMVGLAATGVLGLVLALTARAGIQRWMQTAGRVTLGVLLAALATGMLAAQINWGGVFWDEPLMIMLVRTILVFAVAHLLGGWLPWKRAGGLLVAGATLFILAGIRFTPQVLHPGNAISSSASAEIRLTFVGLFALCVLAAAWIVWQLRRLLDSPPPPVA